MRLPSSASHRRYPLLPIKHERREFLGKRRPANLLLRMSVAGGNRRAGMADRRLLGSLTSTFSIPPTSAGRLALDGLPRRISRSNSRLVASRCVKWVPCCTSCRSSLIATPTSSARLLQSAPATCSSATRPLPILLEIPSARIRQHRKSSRRVVTFGRNGRIAFYHLID